LRFFRVLYINVRKPRKLKTPDDRQYENGGNLMAFRNETKRENNDKNRRSNPNERKRADSNRDGDSQRNRSDDDLYGTDEY
jgi:hypothetical protein